MALFAAIFSKYAQNINIGFLWHQDLTGYRVRVGVIRYAPSGGVQTPIGEVAGGSANTNISIPIASGSLDSDAFYTLVFERVNSDGSNPVTLATTRTYRLKIGGIPNYAYGSGFTLPAAFETVSDFNAVHSAIVRAYADGGTISQLTYTELLTELSWVL